MHVYIRGQHRFFDDLVNLLVTIASFGVAAQTYLDDVGPFGHRRQMNLTGKLAGVDLLFEPDPLLENIAGDRRADRLELEECPSIQFSSLRLREEPRRVLGPIIYAAFVHYYESAIDAIRAAHGDDTSGWPPVINFGRVVRNAFTHNGMITFDNPRAAPVTWSGLTYGPADNGRQVLYVDLMPADVVLLMEDMDQTF